jgi:hypothetical protein
MKFEYVQDALFEKEMIVEYESLTSSKIHKKKCTVEKKNQQESDKILVWNLTDNKFSDIEISTIVSIYPC